MTTRRNLAHQPWWLAAVGATAQQCHIRTGRVQPADRLADEDRRLDEMRLTSCG